MPTTRMSRPSPGAARPPPRRLPPRTPPARRRPLPPRRRPLPPPLPPRNGKEASSRRVLDASVPSRCPSGANERGGYPSYRDRRLTNHAAVPDSHHVPLDCRRTVEPRDVPFVLELARAVLVPVILCNHLELRPRQIEPADEPLSVVQRVPARRLRKAGASQQQPQERFPGRLDSRANECRSCSGALRTSPREPCGARTQHLERQVWPQVEWVEHARVQHQVVADGDEVVEIEQRCRFEERRESVRRRKATAGCDAAGPALVPDHARSTRSG